MIYFKYSFYVFLVFQCKCWKYIKAAWIKKHRQSKTDDDGDSESEATLHVFQLLK